MFAYIFGFHGGGTSSHFLPRYERTERLPGARLQDWSACVEGARERESVSEFEVFAIDVK